MSTHLLDRRSPMRRPLLTIWLIVNIVNLAQAVGFVSRVSGDEVQRVAGLVIAALVVPAAWALINLVRHRSGRGFSAGPAAFLAFVAMHVGVEYSSQIEFRSPARPEILVPYLVLFFGSIVLMGAPMYRIDRRLWTVTAATSVILLTGMGYAMLRGVG